MDQTDVTPAADQRIGKTGDPCAMVIFGASGDLTRRKLIPALYNLARNELLSREFAVIGVARSPMSTEDYRKKVSEDIKQFATAKVEPDIWERFVRRLHYLSGDMGDKNLYLQLKDLLDRLDKEQSTHGNHMYYMATSAEFFGPAVEQLGGYYDEAGALRDMVPNHIMQLISLTSMEPPVSFRADAVRDEQGKILHAIQPMSSEDVLTRTVRGQYGEGIVSGERVPAYRSEPGVPSDSRTETFVAMKLQIDNWRWADVPFYLRTGKRLPGRSTSIVIQFRRAPFVLFRDTPVENLMPNQLVLHIQPEEGISLRFAAKAPGPVMRLGPVDMNFAYADYFGQQPNTGYERLLHDCMIGDPTLFQRADMVEAGWCVVSPLLDVWKALPPRNFPNYAAGTWGPKEADDLLERDGRRWRNFEK